MNKLTVIMPVYNNLPYLKEAIKSVENQNFKDWELIISDDQSTDGSIEYLKKVKNQKIKIFFQKKNLGIYGNLKFLNSKTKTSIVKILCADDKLLKNSLKETYQFMQKKNSCKLLSCEDSNKKNITSDLLTFQNEFYELNKNYYIKFSPEASMIAFLAYGNLCGNLSKVTYRKVNDKINPAFNSKYTFAGDFNAWVRFSKKYGLYLLKKKLIYVRDHPGRATYYLNKNNKLYYQLSKIYIFLIKNINSKYHSLLRKNLLLNDLPQRLTQYLNFLFSGKIKKANSTFINLPFKIKIYECFLFAILFKFRNNKLNYINNYYRSKVTKIIKENL